MNNQYQRYIDYINQLAAENRNLWEDMFVNQKPGSPGFLADQREFHANVEEIVRVKSIMKELS
jgi:hypothetical protein